VWSGFGYELVGNRGPEGHQLAPLQELTRCAGFEDVEAVAVADIAVVVAAVGIAVVAVAAAEIVLAAVESAAVVVVAAGIAAAVVAAAGIAAAAAAVDIAAAVAAAGEVGAVGTAGVVAAGTAAVAEADHPAAHSGLDSSPEQRPALAAAGSERILAGPASCAMAHRQTA
jgi:hypothetical protein